MTNEKRFPKWLIALSITQAGALLVFMSFAGALPLLQKDWQLSHAQAGSIQAAGQVGYLVAVLVISSLTDYMDSKILIVGGALWAGFWNLMFAFTASNTLTAVIFRAMIGFGIAGIYMPGVKLISQKIDPVQRGRALGFYVASFSLGSAMAIALGGNLSSMIGWRNAFGLISIGPFLGAGVAFYLLPKGGKPETSEDEKRPLSDLLKNKPALLVNLIYICHAWEVLGLRSWLPAFLTQVRVTAGASLESATQMGSGMAGIATIVAAAGTATVAAVSDRVGRSRTIQIVMAASFIFTLFLGTALTYSWIIVITITFIVSFLTNADSAVISATLTETVPADYLGRALAVYSFLGFGAGSISPLVFGSMLDYFTQAASLPWAGEGTAWILAFASLAAASVIGLASATALKRQNDSAQI